jgi:hypothetical protein
MGRRGHSRRAKTDDRPYPRNCLPDLEVYRYPAVFAGFTHYALRTSYLDETPPAVP